MEDPLIHYLSQSAMASRGQYMSAFMPLGVRTAKLRCDQRHFLTVSAPIVAFAAGYS
jgi:hypothetical protein